MSNLYEDSLNEQELLMISEDVPPMSMPQELKSSIWNKINSKIENVCPAGGKTVFAKDGAWFYISDKIKIKILHQDFENQVQTSIWDLEPGAEIIAHEHTLEEECLVLEGTIEVGNHQLSVGDYHFMSAGSKHPKLSTKNGAKLFLKHDMHEVLLGPDKVAFTV